MYLFFLNKLTFHSINRVVLLLLVPLSLLIPFSNNLLSSFSSKLISIPLFEQVKLDAISSQLHVVEQPFLQSSFHYSNLFTSIYWLVFSICILRILITVVQLLLARNNAIIKREKGYQIIITNVPEVFSYFRWIFIPTKKFEEFDPQILEHEKAHIELKHSWDVLFIEFYIAFFWFNPLLYYYRKSLKSVHEFQADRDVLLKGVKKSLYMQLLVNSLEISKPNNFYNYFNEPILKKRITMMTKSKSKSSSKLNYIFLLPVCIFFIFAFTKPNIEKNDLVDPFEFFDDESAPSFVFPVQNATKDHITAYFGEEGKHPTANKGVIHKGIDIRAKKGTPVIATTDGVIGKASLEGDWGNLIVIFHKDGYETWYAHLNGFKVKEGQQVNQGDIIGYVGNTGRSTGPHLHYEVKHNGENRNPLNYIE